MNGFFLQKNKTISLASFSRVTLYCLIYWSLFSLSATGQVPLSALVFFFGLVTYSLSANSILKRLPSGVWTLMTLFIFLFAVLYSRHDFLMALLILLLYLIVNKISNPMNKRDEIQTISLCFLLCVCSAVVTDSIILSIFLLGYILLFILSLMLATFRYDQEEARHAGGFGQITTSPKEIIRMRPLSLFLYNTKLLPLLLPITVILFLFIPRFSSQNFFSAMEGIHPTLPATGYNESVQLGSMVGLKKDRTIVLRVQPLRSDGSSFRLPYVYMRGTSLDFYDGRNWLKSEDAKGLTDGVQTNMVNMNYHPYLSGNLLRQRIILESAVTPYIFGINYPYSYRFSKPIELAIDYESGSVRLTKEKQEKISYTSHSLREMENSRSRIAAEHNTDSLQPPHTRFTRLYLQTPWGDLDHRIPDLGQKITENAVSLYEKTVRIQNYLLTNYTYSLDFVEKGTEDPLEEFLFDRKSGHCEYFATAMVMLCRAAGIPARIVNGFYSTEWNNYGEYFIVRQQDAHSWVEAWFAHTGWISFEPTPPGGLERARAMIWIPTGIQKIYDSLKFKWYRHIIDYSFADQLQLGDKLGRATGGLNTKLKQWGVSMKILIQNRSRMRIPKNLTMLFVIIGAGMVSGTIVITILRRFSGAGRKGVEKSRNRAGGKSAVIKEYEAILVRLQNLGMIRASSQTPWEFAVHVIRQDRAWADFFPLTLRYYALRYRHDPLTPEDRESFRLFLHKLEK